jgi:hypothetical protein
VEQRVAPIVAPSVSWLAIERTLVLDVMASATPVVAVLGARCSGLSDRMRVVAIPSDSDTPIAWEATSRAEGAHRRCDDWRICTPVVARVALSDGTRHVQWRPHVCTDPSFGATEVQPLTSPQRPAVTELDQRLLAMVDI